MADTNTHDDVQDIAARGDDIYEHDIKAVVEPAMIGQYVAIDVDSGEYAVRTRRVEATQAIHDRQPGARLWIRRVGYACAVEFGGSSLSARL